MRKLVFACFMSACSVSGHGESAGQSESEFDIATYIRSDIPSDADAQYNLGIAYATGRGVIRDLQEAVKWFRMSAEQGHADAQLHVANSYANGKGVIQDFQEAVKWYRLSAAQGHSYAQLALGFSYANGRGVVQDDVIAHMWLNLAASQGENFAIRLRETISEQMTAQQLAEAQRLARECLDRNFKDC